MLFCRKCKCGGKIFHSSINDVMKTANSQRIVQRHSMNVTQTFGISCISSITVKQCMVYVLYAADVFFVVIQCFDRVYRLPVLCCHFYIHMYKCNCTVQYSITICSIPTPHTLWLYFCLTQVACARFVTLVSWTRMTRNYRRD